MSTTVPRFFTGYDVAFFATTTLMLALVPHTVKSK